MADFFTFSTIICHYKLRFFLGRKIENKTQKINNRCSVLHTYLTCQLISPISELFSKRWSKTGTRLKWGLRHLIHQHTAQGLPFVTNGIEGIRSLKWEVRGGEKNGLLCSSELIFQCFSSRETARNLFKQLIGLFKEAGETVAASLEVIVSEDSGNFWHTLVSSKAISKRFPSEADGEKNATTVTYPKLST